MRIEQRKEPEGAAPRRSRRGEQKNIVYPAKRREQAQQSGERYQHVDGRRTVPRDEGTPRSPSEARVITASVIVPIAPAVSACNAVVGGSSGRRPLIAKRMKPTASHPYPR